MKYRPIALRPTQRECTDRTRFCMAVPDKCLGNGHAPAYCMILKASRVRFAALRAPLTPSKSNPTPRTRHAQHLSMADECQYR